jgi:hypothetical protein
MTARHSPLFTLRSGQSGLGIYTSQRDAADAVVAIAKVAGSVISADDLKMSQA